jgi:hypothetical protein
LRQAQRPEYGDEAGALRQQQHDERSAHQRGQSVRDRNPVRAVQGDQGGLDGDALAIRPQCRGGDNDEPRRDGRRVFRDEWQPSHYGARDDTHGEHGDATGADKPAGLEWVTRDVARQQVVLPKIGEDAEDVPQRQHEAVLAQRPGAERAAHCHRDDQAGQPFNAERNSEKEGTLDEFPQAHVDPSVSLQCA